MVSYGLCGQTLKHSYSELLHSLLGNTDYRLLNFTKEEFYEFMRTRAFRAVNVTIPYKKDALELCDTVSDEAASIGSVNTVVNRNGVLHGYNTDYFGFAYLLDSAHIDVSGKKVLILGTGGTSLTAHAVVKDRNAREIHTVSRTGSLNYENIGLHADADILINTTPVGMFPNGGVSPVGLSTFPQLCGVVDVIYNPLRTKLVSDAQNQGIPAVGGLAMLAAQAVAAHELFFDKAFADRGAVIREVLDGCMQKVSSFVLVGMPGSGKSTLGRLLAAHLGLPFFDADERFTEVYGKTPAEVITQSGESVFRSMETEVLSELTAHGGRVIATGGGAVLAPFNRYLLKQNAAVIYLQRPLSALATDGRPLSGGGKNLEKLFSERDPLYLHVADVCCEVADSPVESLRRLTDALERSEKIPSASDSGKGEKA